MSDQITINKEFIVRLLELAKKVELDSKHEITSLSNFKSNFNYEDILQDRLDRPTIWKKMCNKERMIHLLGYISALEVLVK